MLYFMHYFLGAASTGISKSKSHEYEVSPFPRPVSVVAPSNNNSGTNKLNFTSELGLHKLTSSFSQACSLSQDNYSPRVVDDQQCKSPPGLSGVNGIPRDLVSVSELSSVSVSRCLRTVPSQNTVLNNLSQLPRSSMQECLANKHEIMYDKLRPLIKEVIVHNHQLHIFKLKEKPYITSAEVSSFFPRWKKKDHLSKMIKLKKQSIPSIEISREGEDYEWFFEQCLIEEVLGIVTEDGELVDSVTLYPMESLINMLSLFGSGGGLSESEITRLSDAVKQEHQTFNPLDEFWS